MAFLICLIWSDGTQTQLLPTVVTNFFIRLSSLCTYISVAWNEIHFSLCARLEIETREGDKVSSNSRKNKSWVANFFFSSEVHHDVCYVRANACFVFVIVWASEWERPSLFLGASFARCGSVSYAQRFMSYEPQEETSQGLFSVCPDGVRISIHHFWWKWCLYHQYFYIVVACSCIMPIPFPLRNCGSKSAYFR